MGFFFDFFILKVNKCFKSSYLFLSLSTVVIQNIAHTQILYHQDIVKGGVCFAGFSAGLSYGSGTFETHYDVNSQIKNVYLIYNVHGNPNQNILLTLDNTLISITNETYNFKQYQETQFSEIFKYGINIIDITNIYQNQSIHTISIPNQSNLECGINCSYRNFGIVILYENELMDEISFSLFLNDQNLNTSINSYEGQLNSVNLNQPIGFSINSDIIGHPSTNDGSFISINNQIIGLIGGADNVNSSFAFGTRGHFYHFNNQLIGLDDDIGNSTMNNSDALADISSYISSPDISWKLQWQNSNVHQNIYTSFIFSHSTPCTPFDVTVTPDTVVCLGSSIQLSASGGTAYEWQPATGLSCNDCPNPIATLDSSQLYTVRIWNNDSCSVVRPVKVNVRELPAFQSVNPVATACGTETGSVIVVANNATAKPLSYSLNGGTFETSSTFTGEFTELGAGTYTLTLQDAFGCQRDTVFSIVSNNTTQAQFTANPQSGASPLEVSFTNTSTNASNYEWFVTSGSTSTNQGSSLSSITFNTSGVYTVTLVAWQNSSACADTFSAQILVFDSLLLQIPNVFTPNNDGVNDVFSITSNLPASYTFTLLNRWGTVVASKKSTFAPNVPELLWDGKNATDGTYFYTLEVEWQNETKKVEGFVVKIGD